KKQSVPHPRCLPMNSKIPAKVKTEERRGVVMVFLVPALLVRINGTQFGHLERRVKTVRVTPCKPAYATSNRDCERERGRALMLISTSRPSNSKKRSSHCPPFHGFGLRGFWTRLHF